DRPLEGDERGYAAVAGSLARGEGFQVTIEGTSTLGEPISRTLHAYRAPLLPLVVAPVHALTDGSPFALRLWNCLLGALAAPLAFLVAGRLAGCRGAWLAGLLVALWPTQAWLSARVLTEPLDAVLLLAGCDLLLRSRWRTAGLALGLAVLCRPGGLPAVVLLSGATALIAAPQERRRAAVSVLGVAALVVAPWMARNAAVVGSPVLVTTSGVTLLGGNHPEADGRWAPPERAWSGDDAPDLGMYGWSELDEAGSSARFRGRALRWAGENPGRFTWLMVRKAWSLVDPDHRSGRADAGRKRLIGWLSWGPLLLILAAALGRGRRWRPPHWWVAVAVFAGHLVTAVLAYGDARMRAPMIPVLISLLAVPIIATSLGWTPEARDATVEP
ncbi:MAG: hypothetical protein ACYTG4_09015, partial [Planctomycetota bacterium]